MVERLLADAYKGLRTCKLYFPICEDVDALEADLSAPLVHKAGTLLPYRRICRHRAGEWPLSTPDEEEVVKEEEKIGHASKAEMSKIIGDGRRFCHHVRPSPSAFFGVVVLPARFQGHKTDAAAVDPAAAYCVAVTSGGRLAASSSQASSCP